jgi:hypothetical protein
MSERGGPSPRVAPREDPVAAARAVARLLDDAVRVPGTNMRVGLDPLLGLVPGLGDVAGASLAGYTILTAARLGAPRSVILRMLGNVAFDTLVGTVPLLGDLFDAGWKANLRNVQLLERYLDRPAPTGTASRNLVALVFAALVMLAAAGVIVAGAVVIWLLRALGVG